ncbi:MAG: TonB family protein [Chloracidobacterium sp.]|nr:TonB family protein [Chloracidobacterium sp.]
MLDQLVESKSNSRENKRRSEFLAVVLIIMVSILLGSWTYSLFAKDFGMGGDELALDTLVAPVPVTEEEPPKPEEKQPEKQVAADTRKELIASIDMLTKEPPPISTAKMTKATIRPEFNTKLGDSDSNTTIKADAGRGAVVDNGSTTGISGGSTEKPPASDDEPPPPPKKVVPKTVSGGVLNGKATSLPKPAYPAAAKAIRAGGPVSVQVLIDESGRVVSASAVSGNPLLRAAAVAAAQGARFSPTLLSGQPVKVSGVITYNFVP